MELNNQLGEGQAPLNNGLPAQPPAQGVPQGEPMVAYAPAHGATIPQNETDLGVN